jgi:hypothetical protein
MDPNILKNQLNLHFLHLFKELNQSEQATSCEHMENLLSLMEFLSLNEEKTTNLPLVEQFKQKFNSFSIFTVRQDFKRSHYATCLYELISYLTQNFERLSCNQAKFNRLKTAILNLITCTNFSDTFNVLYDFSINLK